MGQLSLLLAGSGLSRLSRLGLYHALLEFIHASSGIDKLLRASVKRVANIANAQNGRWLGGTGRNYVAAGATNFGRQIFRMNINFHKSRAKQHTSIGRDDKHEIRSI